MKRMDTYKNYIQTIKTEKKEAIDKFLSMQCEDDATFAKIELNIIEIFEQMFSISEKKALSDKVSPIESLKNTYLGFFEKIPSSWIIQLEKSKKFGNDEETYKETLKINQANLMKTRFLELFDEVKNETKQ